jgi:serine/threonine protein kinase
MHDDNEILNKYLFGFILGEGAFSEVFLATNKQTGEKVAVKRIHKLSKDDMWTRRKGAQKDEITLLKLLNHAKIIKLKEFFETRDKLYIVQEYCAGGNLNDVIRKEGGLSETRAKHIFIQLLQAVSYLHACNIVHRDIKSENVLLKEKYTDDVRLLDFGLSRLMPRAELLMTSVGTLDYKAPEVCLSRPYGAACDCWSLGVVLYEMLCGELPCLFTSDEAVVDFAKNGVKFTGNKWANISEPAKDLVRNLLVFEPEKRYTCEEALACQWLSPAVDEYIM